MDEIDPNSLSLRVYPDPILKEVCTPFSTPLPDNIAQIAEHMLDIMYDYEGIGLAAPQAGLNKRIIVYDLSEKGDDPHALINPEIVDFDKNEEEGEEGCLSFPEIRAPVKRWPQIKIKALELNGDEIEFECDELMAIMFQHEIDHLNGISFVERLVDEEKENVSDQLTRLERMS
jgi:peptide deformylase